MTTGFGEKRMRYLGTGADSATTVVPVIAGVEQLVGSGDSLITVGTISDRRYHGGGFGGVHEAVTVRLNAADRDELLARLATHRDAAPAPDPADTDTDVGRPIALAALSLEDLDPTRQPA